VLSLNWGGGGVFTPLLGCTNITDGYLLVCGIVHFIIITRSVAAAILKLNCKNLSTFGGCDEWIDGLINMCLDIKYTLGL